MPGHIKKTSGPDPDPSPWVKDNSHQSLTTKSFSKNQSLGDKSSSTRQIQPILRMIAKTFSAGGEGPHQGGPEEEGLRPQEERVGSQPFQGCRRLL